VPEYNLIVDEVFKRNKSMELKLTKEAVKKMFHMWTNKNEPDFIPTLQIVYVKELFTLSSSAVSLSVVYLRTSSGFFLSSGQSPTLPLLTTLPLTFVDKQGTSSKWKVVLSDGAYLMTGICSQSLSQQFETGYIQNGSVIRLHRFNIETTNTKLTNNSRGLTAIKKICIIVDAKVISTGIKTMGKGHRDVNKIWKCED